MRVRKNQSAHDTCVQAQAELLLNDGCTVKADLKNWERPPEINGYIPDIYAEKISVVRIFEVETEDTINDEYDIKQRAAFKKYADSNPMIFFWVYVADEEGRCHYHPE